MNLSREKQGCFLIINSLKAKYGIDPLPDVMRSLGADRLRIIGRYWELAFCEHALEWSKHFTPTQIGLEVEARWYGPGAGSLLFASDGLSKSRRRLLPDITVWSFPGEHHEVKHKDPFTNRKWHRSPLFGLELYRIEALWKFADVTGQDVMYTIHDHSQTDGRLSTESHIDHWLTCNVLDLKDTDIRSAPTQTLYGGRYRSKPTLYWPITMWTPLARYWKRQKESYIHSCRRICKKLALEGFDSSSLQFANELCERLKKGA